MKFHSLNTSKTMTAFQYFNVTGNRLMSSAKMPAKTTVKDILLGFEWSRSYKVMVTP